jgi:predicted permease
MSVVNRFILIVSGIAVAAAIGYVARKRDWLKESSAGPMMLYTVIFGWTPASMLVLWQLKDMKWSLVALPLLSAIVPILLFPFGLLLAKLHRLDRKSAGTFIVACGISNTGFTMGAFVCYCLFGMDGLGYANLFAASWAVPYVGFYYSVARRFGDPAARLDVWFILRTLFDLRSLPILGSIVGLALNLLKVRMPEIILTFHAIDLLIIFSVLISFAIIGLQLHFSHLAQKKILHASLGLAKFAITPAILISALAPVERLLGVLPPVARRVLYIEAFVPTAVFTVIIANLFHLDSRLASMLFLVNTVVFLIVVLPVLAYVISR